MRSKRDSRRPSATVARGIRQVQLGNDGDIADWRRSGLFDGLYFNLSGALIEETYSIGTRVMLSSDGNVYPITQRDLDLGNVDIGTDDPLQQVLDGMECRGAMWFWRPVIYTIGTAEMAALAGATAAGAGASVSVVGRFSSSAIRQGVNAVLSNGNNVGHIFRAKHLLEPLLLRYGTKAAVLSQILNQLNGNIPASGVINQTINLAGYTVRVTGQVVNGVPMISNVWIPMGPHP